MKTLIWKEWRENFKVAVLGLIVFSIVLFVIYRGYLEIIRDVARDSHPVWSLREKFQPLNSDAFLASTASFCALFGVLLGWLQIFNERHRDLWAFLAHRPVTRTEIFRAKVVAGLCFYAIVTGLPLFFFALWAILPGHVAAPFDWAMLLPMVTHFVAGTLYYFAGMLTGLRQARWYLSRGLGIGVALAGSAIASTGIVTGHVWEFLLLSLGGTVLGTAVWGAFHSHGQAEGQPRMGKFALTAVLTIGTAVVLFAAIGLLTTILSTNEYVWSSYVVAKDGKVYKHINESGRLTIAELDGKPLIDPKTKHPMQQDAFYRDMGTRTANLDLEFAGLKRQWDRATLFRTTPESIWYYWSRYGQLVGYDIASRRRIGFLGPNGFSAKTSRTSERFLYPIHNNFSTGSPTLQSTSTVYKIDVENRTSTPIFSTALDDPIADAADLFGKVVQEWSHTVMATRRFLYLLRPDGSVVWKLPLKPIGPDYKDITVAFLETADQFAVLAAPSSEVKEKSKQPIPVHALWLAAGEGVTKRADLPGIPLPAFSNAFEQTLTSALIPWLLTEIVSLRNNNSWPWHFAIVSLVATLLISVPIGWWICQRYHFSRASQIRWAISHLLFGLPGLLAFLSLNDWPARERCPNCQKLRVVTRVDCEHCGADFPPPAKTGIEIFEVLAAR